MAYRVSVSDTEPVSRAEAVAYAKIENTDENSIVDALISSCRNELEEWLKIPLITQVWAEYADTFNTPIYAPMIPVTSVVLEVADSDAVYAADTNIAVRVDTGRIAPTTSFSPAIEFDAFRFTFTYTVTSIMPVLKDALLELFSYRFYNRGNVEAAAIPASVKAMVGHLRVFSQ